MIGISCLQRVQFIQCTVSAERSGRSIDESSNDTQHCKHSLPGNIKFALFMLKPPSCMRDSQLKLSWTACADSEV